MGSASQPMLVIKANRALLRKRRSYSEIRDAYNGYTDDLKLHFKELTPFEQKKIRDKIIAQARRDKMLEIRAYFISLVILCVLFFGIYYFFFLS
ncbi:hypothetical protein [Flagellimonas flava]|uniref:Uncharacterized protein n=1 Tax=Flagellimonas flava TaxID=570519 RepID=A0A1M5KNA8_9FLAO|nr:hypothetical protein [Allomuricauda flava]SHG54248.1 hypothetical protein SAMN04488116_1684 [Allomuricauda flava]